MGNFRHLDWAAERVADGELRPTAGPRNGGLRASTDQILGYEGRRAEAPKRERSDVEQALGRLSGQEGPASSYSSAGGGTRGQVGGEAAQV